MRIIGMMLLCVTLGGPLRAETESASQTKSTSATNSFDLSKRIPWTTSRVIGSPDPPPPYRASKVFEKLKIDQPIAVEHEPGTKNLLLVHQDTPWVGKGRILRMAEESGGSKVDVLLDTNHTIYSLAFHPDYVKNGYLYVGSNGPVTAEDKDIPGRRFRPTAKKMSTISRYTVSREPPFAVVPHSEQVIIEWPSNGHNGAGIAFGKDGMLYVTSGDGTSDSDTDLAGQDLTRLLAKVLRIDVDHPDKDRPYSVPNDNPFVGVKAARPETWAYGFRNPWRLHVDRVNGDIWVGQNGQDLWEQVYLVRRGANYGWSLFEGSHPFQPDRQQGPTPISRPIADHHHSEARSLTGGVVYYGKRLPKLRGAYVYGDWSTGKIWGIRHRQGKVTWHRELADTALQVVGFGTDSRGELLIVDYGSGLYQLEKVPEDESQNKEFPKRLSDTGLYTSVKDHQMHPALIPYSVYAPLWSDGAHKERWIALPGETRIKFTALGGWNFPDGAVLVKTFSLELDAGVPSSRRRIETRLLTKQQGEWQGYSYVWNKNQTDATLVDSGGEDLELIIRDAGASGGKRVQSWRLPSRAECMVCHSRAANFVLGLNVLQMNKMHHYGTAKKNQLEVLQQLSIFSVARELHKAEGKKLDKELDGVLPKRPREYPHLVDPYDDREDLTARARSYLHANCAQCHVTAGGGNSQINLAFATKLAEMKLIDELPQHKDFAKAGTPLVQVRDPENSILYQRITRRGRGQMPPLATSLVDRRAAKLLHNWISSLPVGAKAQAGDVPTPIYAKGAQLKVEWIKRIWSAGEHNAFPDIERFRDKWFVATREGTAHGISGFGRVRVISSDDGKLWQSVALLDGFGDYRRGELSVTADGRLMLTTKFNLYGKADDATSRTYKARDHAGKEHEVFTRGVENHVAFSTDGVQWTKKQTVKGTHPSAWFYSGVQWNDGIGYAIDRKGRKLYRTKDGVNFEPVSDVPVGNESRISFLPDKSMIVFFRDGSLATTPPPYVKWTVNEQNKKGPHSYGGPGIIALPNNEVWTASRHRIDPKSFDFPKTENVFPDGTVLFKLQGDRLSPQLLIRGGGDRGYNGLVWHDGFLWMVYNAPSREANRSSIHLAKIRLK